MDDTFQEELNNYKAMINETQMRLAEIKREAYEFKRVVLGKGVDEKTGKIKADSMVRYYEDKIRAKVQNLNLMTS